MADSLSFLGHAPYDLVFHHMRCSTASLLLSTNERLPNDVKEAMVCGCIPVVATTPGIDELVEDGDSGFLVPPRRIDLVAVRIDRILRGGDGNDVMRHAAQRWVEERVDARVNITNCVETWTDLMAHQRP